MLVGVTVALGAPAGAQTPAVPQGADIGDQGLCVAPGPHGFSDVPSGSSYDVAVGWLVSAGITTGTSPGVFSPAQPVTRAQMAVFLWRNAGSPAPVGTNDFVDVPSGASYEAAVIWLVGAGITTGTSPGHYSPSQPVTRAQMAVFLWRNASSPAPLGTNDFDDVPSGASYEAAVIWLVGKGITTGTSPGHYSPGQPVTRAQMAVFLWRSSCGDKLVMLATGPGSYSTCALRLTGTVACWGDNIGGQLGDGTTTDRSIPTPVPGLTGVTAITAGGNHTCALKQNGTVSCWGNDEWDQNHGAPTTPNQLTPTPVPGLTGATAITAGIGFTCAVKQDSTVACWGYNYAGQFGNGTYTGSHSSSPTPVTGLTGVTAVTAGGYHACALKQDHTVACWGYNKSGQVGDGTTTSRLTPTPVSGLIGATAISASDIDTCALKQDKTVACWGYNGFGGLGDGTTTDRLAPTPVTGLTGATALTAGGVHTCAIKQDTTVACWGGNYVGQLGDGTTINRLTPTPVTGLTGATALAAGEAHTCAVKQDQTGVCWGFNYFGQLGDGTTTDRLTPTPVSGF